MKQTTFSDLERNNKTCMYAHLIDSSIMTLFCILQAPLSQEGNTLLLLFGQNLLFPPYLLSPFQSDRLLQSFSFGISHMKHPRSSILLPSVSLFFTVLQSSLQPTVSYFYLLSR